MSDEVATPGWYEPEGEPGRKRWWDGEKWGEYFDEQKHAPAEVPSAKAEEKPKTQLEPNLAAIGVAVIGGIIALISIFLPELDSTTFSHIADNTMIQNGDGWLIILFSVGVLAGAWKAYSTKNSTWTVAVFGALIIAIAVYDGTGTRTELHSAVKILGESVKVKGSAGVGIYAAGVGGALSLLAGLNLAMGGTILESGDAKGRETRQCPDCAEWVLAEARKCRYCGHEFGDVARADAA